MGKIIKSPRYVIDIIGMDPLSVGELGRGAMVNSEKLEKMRYFYLTKQVLDLNEISDLEGPRYSNLLF